MNEIITQEQLITLDNETGLTIVKYEIGALIKALEDEVDRANENEKKLREAILNAMRVNNIYQAKVDGYTISQVMPKSTKIFNEEEFITNVDADISAAFVSVVETDNFDLDKFKTENPELYKKYVTTTTEIRVDEKKLSKMLPSLYEKYTSEIKSDKCSTLRITKSKGE